MNRTHPTCRRHTNQEYNPASMGYGNVLNGTEHDNNSNYTDTPKE